jgi:adenine-specific DNA-methyltransferase
MAGNQKLELTWIGRDQRPRLEPRILLEDPKRSYHAKQRVTDGDLFDNRLIKGDNLLALKALEAEFAGKVKCVFIDPPYNTGMCGDLQGIVGKSLQEIDGLEFPALADERIS